jgi:hypothetical protein
MCHFLHITFVTLTGTGTAVQEDLAHFNNNSRLPWNTTFCGTIFPGATLPIANTMQMGEFLCQITSNMNPWVGLSRFNATSLDQRWIWVDGVNETVRIPQWVSTPDGKECNHTGCYIANCTQIICNSISRDRGRLYDGFCSKNAPYVCEIKCTAFLFGC